MTLLRNNTPYTHLLIDRKWDATDASRHWIESDRQAALRNLGFHLRNEV